MSPTQALLEIEGFETEEDPKKTQEPSNGVYDPDDNAQEFFNQEDYEYKGRNQFEVTITFEEESDDPYEPPQKPKPTVFMTKKGKMTLIARLLAAASYLGFLWIGVLFIGSTDQNIRFHIRQGTRLSLVELGAALMVKLILFATTFTLELLSLGALVSSWLPVTMNWLVGTYFVLLSLKGIFHALTNRQYRLPTSKLFLHFDHIKIKKSQLIV